jgi:DNA recombination protein RmuC
MNQLIPLLALLGGLVAGSAAVWLFLRAKAAAAAAQVRAELEPELATLRERVSAKESAIASLEASLASQESQKASLATRLQDESQAKAAGEERCRQLEQQLKARAEQVEAAAAQLDSERCRTEDLTQQLAAANAQARAEAKARTQTEQELAHAREQAGLAHADLLKEKLLTGELAEKVKSLQERLLTQKAEIEGIQLRFQKDFEAIANRLLLENSSRFGQQSTESLDKLLSPFRENLKDLRAKLESVQQDTATHSALLKDQISRIGAEAANLSKALKGDIKVLGNWGENMLDQILERSGLQMGLHYRRQSSAKETSGEQRFLDVLVQLPENKHLVIDSKVSLRCYEDYVNCEDEAARSERLEAHIACIRSHFRGLGAKRYQDVHGISTPDFVLMYIPIEAAFFSAVGHEPGLFSEALEKNVVLTTNSTLLATLRTVAHVWRLADQQKYALEIADRGGKLYDKFVGFIEDLRAVGGALKNAQAVWEEADRKLHQGSGNLVGQVEKLRALGVKASKKLTLSNPTPPLPLPPESLADGNGHPPPARIVIAEDRPDSSPV